MADARATATAPRIWVPLSIVLLALLVTFVPAWIAPMTLVHFMSIGFGPMLGLLGALLWWLFARRVSWRDRLLGAGAAVAVLVLAIVLSDSTITFVHITRGLPAALALLALGLVLTRAWPWSKRRWLLAASLALGLFPWIPFRVDGQYGSLDFEIAPRWAKTKEAQFLETQGPRASASDARADGALAGVPSSWPGFRGPRRDGVARDVTFATDWSSRPPRERWRRPVGPGWSSFALAGGLAFTQEQRGEDEAVVAYALEDGREVWSHASRERFEEPQGGPGPRATPAYDDGRLYTFGARGTLTALDAATGRRLWSVNVVEDLGAPVPSWGFSSSPLVLGNAVIVFTGADAGRGLAAYDRESGKRLWTAGNGTRSYSSPFRADFGGVEQAVIATEFGVQAFGAGDGALLWQHEWPVASERIGVPMRLEDERGLIIPTGYGQGMRRIEIAGADGRFTTTPVWDSRFLQTYFNDSVVHEGHVYGFDGAIFACVGVDDGQRRWKGGRYGNGQVVALPDMDALLVLSEKGELVLVAADPTALRELGRMQALGGKTWNHPVVADGLLLVRNDEEAVCYELPPAS